MNARPEVDKLERLSNELKALRREGYDTTNDSRYTEIRRAGGLLEQKSREVDRAKARVRQLVSQEFGVDLLKLYSLVH